MFVSEDFSDIWIKWYSTLRQTVTVANKMDKCKGKAGHFRGKLILDGKTYGVQNQCNLPSDIILNESCERQNDSILVLQNKWTLYSKWKGDALW